MSEPFYQETTVAGGPTVLSHVMPQAQSVALGVFIDVGSRDESIDQAGITHALEHMLFKGTKSMDVHVLAEKLDELGGNANAYTSRERTCFHLHVLHEHWQEALSILLSMIQEPALPQEEWLREREVIYSEMAMVEDTPEEWVTDQHITAMFPDHAIGRPVLGFHESLESISADVLHTFLQKNYSPPRLLVTAAGRITHDELVDALAGEVWRTGGETAGRQQAPVMATGIQALVRESEQAQIVASFQGIHAASSQRPTAWLANHVLGGGMSSRLFREIRERRGLAYGVGSHLNSLSDVGTWTVTCGTGPERAPECIDVLNELLAEFAIDVTSEEVERAKRQLEVQFRMGMDSVEGQMLYLGARLDESLLIPPMQWLEHIQSVEVEAVQQWAKAQLSKGVLWTVAAPEAALSGICDRIRPC